MKQYKDNNKNCIKKTIYSDGDIVKRYLINDKTHGNYYYYYSGIEKIINEGYYNNGEEYGHWSKYHWWNYTYNFNYYL